jgi:hypothetical protein
LIGIDQQSIVDADFAKLILDDGDALAMGFAEDSIEQSSLARAKKTSDDGRQGYEGKFAYVLLQ